MSLKELSKIFEEAINSKLNIVWGGRPYRDREVMIMDKRFLIGNRNIHLNKQYKKH